MISNFSASVEVVYGGGIPTESNQTWKNLMNNCPTTATRPAHDHWHQTLRLLRSDSHEQVLLD